MEINMNVSATLREFRILAICAQKKGANKQSCDKKSLEKVRFEKTAYREFVHVLTSYAHTNFQRKRTFTSQRFSPIFFFARFSLRMRRKS